MNKMGFGFLRLPQVELNGEKKVNVEACCQLVDRYLAAGGRFFDTAYPYLKGQSETALGEALVKRHPRSAYQICDKLAGYQARSYEDCQSQFEEMLRRVGVEKFDVLMLHWLTKKNYAMAEQYEEFRFLRDMKAAGRAERIGFSYHDSSALLDEILTAHPEVDCVLIQLNYLDWLSPTLQAKALYETVVKHGKRVFVMEPLKGGSLAKLPEDVAALLPGRTPVEWALAFAQSLPGVEVVLSGMNELAQIDQNMRDVVPLTEAETQQLLSAAERLRASIAVACTGCGYCLTHCPKGIAVPEYMALYNDLARNPGDGWKMDHAYNAIAERAAASACIGCRACEKHCPQSLPIAEMLGKLAKEFE